MNKAENSSQEHSAPHGATRAANSSPNSGFELYSAPAVSQSGAAQAGRSEKFRSAQRRVTPSGRALLPLLALGLVLESSSGAMASPSGNWSSRISLVSSTREAGSRAALGLKPVSSNAAEALSEEMAQIALAKQLKLAPPRAALMPRQAKNAQPVFPEARIRSAAKSVVAAKISTAKISTAKKAASPRVLASQPGSARLIQVAQTLLAKTAPAAKLSNASLSAAPAVQAKVAPAQIDGSAKINGSAKASAFKPVRLAQVKLSPAAPREKAELGGMKKVIDVPSLTLSPLSKPLPRWMQNRTVKVDEIGKKPTRISQNPTAPPIRNPGAPVTNSDRLPNQIEVAVSTFVVLMTTTDLQTVAIADPNIADVAVVNSRSVLLNGKAAGVTSLVIVDGQKIRQYSVRVTSAQGERPNDVAAAIGLPGVSVRPIRDALVLEGEVENAEEARRAVEIGGIFSPKVINQLTIRGQQSPEAGTSAELRDLIGIPSINVRVVGDTAVLTGTVDTPQQISDAETIAKAKVKNVINQLRLPILTVDQVRETLGGVATLPDGAVTGPLAPGTFAAPTPLVVREAGGSLIIEGTIDSQGSLDQALAIANRTGLPVISRVQVSAAPTADQGTLTAVAAAIGRPGVRVSGTAKRIVLQGIVANTEEAVAVEQIARAFSLQVDNMLQTPNPRQVDVDVSIVEITRTGLKNLGFTFPSLLDGSNSGFVIGQRSTNADLPGPLGAALDRSVNTQTAFQAALRAQIQSEDVKLLSNPRTTVLSGHTATFQVGGQVPVPVSITQSATGTITGIDFKDFGVLVDVVPNASANGAVTMRVKTEISQPDATIGFTPFAGASIIPGFQRRAATTEVTTPVGGTVALGGLLSNEARTLVSKIPVLSQLPILGKLFTSKRFQNDQTELVIFVTPRLLPNPLAEGTTAPAGVVAAGNTTNVGTVLGNPGLNTGGISGRATGGAQ